MWVMCSRSSSVSEMLESDAKSTSPIAPPPESSPESELVSDRLCLKRIRAGPGGGARSPTPGVFGPGLGAHISLG